MWGVGKTTLCEHLHNTFHLGIVKEPDHLLAGNKKPDNLDDWYIKAHLDNIQKTSRRSKDFVMERSLASTLAFIEARDGKVSKKIISADFKKQILQSYRNISVCFYLQVKPKDYWKIKQKQKSNRIKLLLDDKEFIKRYIAALEKWLIWIFGNRLFVIERFGKVNIKNERHGYLTLSECLVTLQG